MCECSDEEEEIEEELELIEENLGDEGDEVILGVFDDIILIVDGIDVPIEIYFAFWRLHLFKEVLFKLLGVG